MISAFGVEDNRLSKADESNNRRRRNIVAGTAGASAVGTLVGSAKSSAAYGKLQNHVEYHDRVQAWAQRRGSARRAEANEASLHPDDASQERAARARGEAAHASQLADRADRIGSRLRPRAIKARNRTGTLAMGSLVLGGGALGALATGSGKKKKQPS